MEYPISPALADIGSFVEEMRDIHRKSGRTLKGPSGLSGERLKAIRAAAVEVFEHALPLKTFSLLDTARLMERFEEMCRRRNQPIAEAISSPIMQHLLAELKVNAFVLGNCSPDKLVSVTVHCGAVMPVMLEEFRDFADSPYIFKRAAVHNPADPRGFLRRVKTDIAAMALEAEFRDFADSPSIFKYAAVKYPADPRGFLRRVKTDIAAMALEVEFQDFATSPSIFKHAAIGYPADPRGFLRQVKTDIAAMAQEAEFQDFADSPFIFKYAAVNNPADPRGFLRRVKTDTAAMTQEVEFQDFADSPFIFKHAAVNYPADPRGFLRRVKRGQLQIQ